MATALLACALGVSALLLFAAWCDLATRTIPDGVGVAVAGLGLAVRVAEGPAPELGGQLDTMRDQIDSLREQLDTMSAAFDSLQALSAEHERSLAVLRRRLADRCSSP